jgi:hypothetical protein
MEFSFNTSVLFVYLTTLPLTQNVALNRCMVNNRKKTLWPESKSEVYLPSDRRFLVKLVPVFADTGCRVVSATDPHGVWPTVRN